MLSTSRIQVIDTHTGGEPTRVVMSGGPELGNGSLVEQRERFSQDFDAWRRAIVCEPRGSDVIVGALVTAPECEGSLAGVIFFNNVGYLGMCGHGTIGVAVALAHAGRISHGRHLLDTPVGQVAFELLADGQVQIENVASYRFREQAEVKLAGGQVVHGDVAWGGNWFFICNDHGLSVELQELSKLDRLAKQIRAALSEQGVTGIDGEEIDHVELIGPPLPGEQADSRNFVLCPGAAYDRSPCGTGTSAKVACLAASGKLQPGETWRQASLIGSVFSASYRKAGERQGVHRHAAEAIIVSLVGSAFVNAEATLILDPRDPFCMGIG